MLKDFIKFIIEEFGETCPRELEKLTQINLYHRLLECYLYQNQTNETKAKKEEKEKQLLYGGSKSTPLSSQVEKDSKEAKIKEEINTFIERYDSKIDKHYVLFLFQIYEHQEGVKNCCEKLQLKQELLNFYIKQNLPSKVLEVCKNKNAHN